jgi:electron transfer flavoprotein beta subunit
MHLVVCLKQIMDPELPPADFRVDAQKKEAVRGNANLVISVFDENALEVALQLRDAAGGGKITALCVGPESAVDALRKAVSMRADEAIRIREEEFPALDAYGTARLLAAALRKLEPANLVFCGREAGDWHGAIVGGLLAGELQRPFVSLAAAAQRAGETFLLRRQTDEGWETAECSGPAVVSVTNDDANQPRIPKVKDNMMAFRRQIPSWGAAELGIQASEVNGPNAALEFASLGIPKSEKQCQVIGGESVEEKAAKLAQKLADLHVL